MFDIPEKAEAFQLLMGRPPLIADQLPDAADMMRKKAAVIRSTERGGRPPGRAPVCKAGRPRDPRPFEIGRGRHPFVAFLRGVGVITLALAAALVTLALIGRTLGAGAAWVMLPAAFAALVLTVWRVVRR